MNASYKIVLLAAFLLFAAVVGYYALSPGSGSDADGSEARELANNTPDNPDAEPLPREATPPAEDDTPPARNPEVSGPPPAGQVTIGTPPADPIEVELGPVAGTEDGGRLAPAPEGSGERIGPGVSEIDDPLFADPTIPPAPEPGTTDTPPSRPGPGVAATEDGGTTDEPPAGGTTDTPATKTETETEDTPPRRPTPPTPPRSTPSSYTVKSGDTLSSIASEIYGREDAWFEIAQANPSVDPKRLQVDQVIVLPDLDSNVREREEVTPPPPGKDQSYTVRPGDNLSKIAKKFYDDTEAWDLIYARNRDKIGPRPDRLKVGMELIIPQAYSGAE